MCLDCVCVVSTFNNDSASIFEERFPGAGFQRDGPFTITPLFQPIRALIETRPKTFSVESKEGSILCSDCWALDILPAFVAKSLSADVFKSTLDACWTDVLADLI